ncbi:hypothetical protein Y032_0030g2077 [Ancylostoma ceylanicum]|uniref:Uncharacterized protein n=1 Tax=Ancylostoma ceylanicum TaxID=53326 RepID=A0A016UQM0_9BILA|nr:hypothetical protein Y032_0030g2077 [Ancylostoma ceylanicum]
MGCSKGSKTMWFLQKVTDVQNKGKLSRCSRQLARIGERIRVRFLHVVTHIHLNIKSHCSTLASLLPSLEGVLSAILIVIGSSRLEISRLY